MGIVKGQRIDPAKVARAREFRRDLTPAEARLWERLRAHRLNGLHFRRQQVIAGFIVDFYCSAASLAIEVDGGVHLGQRETDAARDAILNARGVRVLRFTNRQIGVELADVLARIAATCADGSPDKGEPPNDWLPESPVSRGTAPDSG